jgi:hypothetical protein
MPRPEFDRLRDLLWPTGRDEYGTWVYALVDAARDVSIYPLIRSESLMTYACLYAGSVPWEMKRVAPHLVLLDRDSEFTNSLIELGWGESWAVYLRCSALPDELRHHFRRLLRVRDERGKTYLFRFYDPRVLRVYLPTCTQAELQSVFGPVDRFIVEGDEPATAIEFHPDGTRSSRSLLTRSASDPRDRGRDDIHRLRSGPDRDQVDAARTV